MSLANHVAITAFPTPDETSSSASNVLNTADLSQLIAEQCSTSSLMNLGNVSRACKFSVVHIIKCRIYNLLQRFFPAEDIVRFFQLLRRTRGALVGSFAFAVIHYVPGKSKEQQVRDLNIVLPAEEGVLLKWKDLLYTLGYTSITNATPSYPYQWTNRKQISFRNGVRQVIVNQATGPSILPTVLSSPVTSMFNVITCSSIYCFYPRLTSSGVALKSHLPVEDMKVKRYTERGVKLYVLNTFMSGPCHESCPKIWRFSHGLKGVGIMNWRGWTDFLEERHVTIEDDNFDKSHFKWRLALDCYNHHCERSVYARETNKSRRF